MNNLIEKCKLTPSELHEVTKEIIESGIEDGINDFFNRKQLEKAIPIILAEILKTEDGIITVESVRMLNSYATHTTEEPEEKDWRYRWQDIAKLQAAATRKDFKEWCEEPCLHVHRTMPNRPKRACDECWASLE